MSKYVKLGVFHPFSPTFTILLYGRYNALRLLLWSAGMKVRELLHRLRVERSGSSGRISKGKSFKRLCRISKSMSRFLDGRMADGWTISIAVFSTFIYRKDTFPNTPSENSFTSVLSCSLNSLHRRSSQIMLSKPVRDQETSSIFFFRGLRIRNSIRN